MVSCFGESDLQSIKGVINVCTKVFAASEWSRDYGPLEPRKVSLHHFMLGQFAVCKQTFALDRIRILLRVMRIINQACLLPQQIPKAWVFPMMQFTDAGPDFWIQMKGLNAGRPLREKIPNSIGVKTDPELLVPDFLFYTLEYLFQSGAFLPLLRGSVVPFLTRRAILEVLSSHWRAQANRKSAGQRCAV